MNNFPVTEADLHAYVDGLLPAVRHAEIDAYLASRPDELARVQTYQAQNASLRALFDPVLDEPVPARLSAPPRKVGWMLQRLAAGRCMDSKTPSLRAAPSRRRLRRSSSPALRVRLPLRMSFSVLM